MNSYDDASTSMSADLPGKSAVCNSISQCDVFTDEYIATQAMQIDIFGTGSGDSAAKL